MIGGPSVTGTAEERLGRGERRNLFHSVGGILADIRLAGIMVKGDDALAPYMMKKVIAAYLCGDVNVPDEAFAELLGYAVPDGRWGQCLTENDAICQLGMRRADLPDWYTGSLEEKEGQGGPSGKPDLNTLFIYNMPFRAIGKMTGGMVDSQMVDGIDGSGKRPLLQRGRQSDRRFLRQQECEQEIRETSLRAEMTGQTRGQALPDRLRAGSARRKPASLIMR